MAQYPASTTGQWAIYSVQKNLGDLLPEGTNNFLVLVDPQGNPVLEMQGLFSGNFNDLSLLQLANGTAQNYLQVRMCVPNQYLAQDESYPPVLVATGSESSIVSAFNRRRGRRAAMQLEDADN